MATFAIYLRFAFTMSAKRDARSALLIESAHFPTRLCLDAGTSLWCPW